MRRRTFGMLEKNFPSKILLFGEYTILNGSKALAIPYDSFYGQWSYQTDKNPLRESSRESLNFFLQTNWDGLLDHDKLKHDFDHGLWFDSSIPQGYGLGSSGALVAALFTDYGKRITELKSARKELAKIESFFHGSSSGLDPLVSFLNSPLLIHHMQEIELLDKKLNLDGFFLLNTKKPRQTGPLVSIYQEKMKDTQFNQNCANVLSQEVNQGIDCLINERKDELFPHLLTISKFQWDFFQEMIPSSVHEIWTRGLDSGDYILKLCGAGGGGYLLGYSEKLDKSQLTKILEPHELRWM
jgi:mevalonate kinase